MTDPDRPVTRRELREELEALFARLATKDDLLRFATKDDLEAFATKDDLKPFATKDDLTAFPTKEDLRAFATKEDLKSFPTKDDLAPFARKDDLSATRAEMVMRFSELRTHLDVVAEDFRQRFGILHDGVYANADSLTKRVVSLEDGHDHRLLMLETRVTRLENPKRS